MEEVQIVEKTVERVTFIFCVLDKTYSSEDADVMLSTFHAARGMEWDNVQVCDNFSFQLELEKNNNGDWQFKSKSYGDDLNLLYVALTRAKKLFSVPLFMGRFIDDCNS